MAFNRPDNIVLAGESSGASFDLSNQTHQCYAGAAVVGGAVVITSVGVTTIAAPGLTLIPLAVAAGAAAYGSHLADKRARENDPVVAPSTTVTEPSVA